MACLLPHFSSDEHRGKHGCALSGDNAGNRGKDQALHVFTPAAIW